MVSRPAAAGRNPSRSAFAGNAKGERNGFRLKLGHLTVGWLELFEGKRAETCQERKVDIPVPHVSMNAGDWKVPAPLTRAVDWHPLSEHYSTQSPARRRGFEPDLAFIW